MSSVTVNTATMNAIVVTQYGGPDVLQLKKVKKPLPKDDEVLVKIRATSVTAAHGAMRTGRPLFGRLFLGLPKPKIAVPGTDFAGEVEAVGKNVKKFSISDEVFGSTDIDGGCYAEYITISEEGMILPKPTYMSFTEATAIIDGATTALPFLRDFAKIQPGQKILINGASGGIGTAAVQLAKYFGAEVTGACSTSNVEWVKSLGADKVIDYTQEDFTRNVGQYDVIFDTVGKSSFSKSKAALSNKGVYLSPVLNLPMLFDMLYTSLFSRGKKAIFSATGLRKLDERIDNLVIIKKLIEQGKLKSVIDQTFSLEEMTEAHRYVDQGHKKGNVVVLMRECN